jgi:hypothetical protein
MFEQIWSVGNSESPCFGIKSEKTTVWIVALSLVHWAIAQWGSTFYGLAQSTSVYSHDLKLWMLKHYFKFYF